MAKKHILDLIWVPKANFGPGTFSLENQASVQNQKNPDGKYHNGKYHNFWNWRLNVQTDKIGFIWPTEWVQKGYRDFI